MPTQSQHFIRKFALINTSNIQVELRLLGSSAIAFHILSCNNKKVCGMQWHLRKENEVVLSYRWQFQDGRSTGMGTEWDKEVVGKVDPQKRVLCLAQVFLRCRTAFANGV